MPHEEIKLIIEDVCCSGRIGAWFHLFTAPPISTPPRTAWAHSSSSTGVTIIMRCAILLSVLLGLAVAQNPDTLSPEILAALAGGNPDLLDLLLETGNHRDPLDKPNIILLIADDMGIGDLSVYGHPTQEPGFIDTMAAQGLRFTNGYVGDSVCTPSRSAIVTGMNTCSIISLN